MTEQSNNNPKSTGIMKEGWEYKKLGEVCEITMGQSPDSSTYNKECVGMPFFQGCADFGEIYPRTTTYCSAPKKIANIKDILMSVRAPIGTLNIADKRCCIGRGLAALSEKQNISNYKFIFYFLKASQKDLQNKGTGATFKAIGKELIINYSIPIPPLSEQQRIVEELDLLSSIIEKKKVQLKELDTLAQSIFYDMFGDPVTNEKGWEVKKLGEISSIGTGATPDRKKENIYYGGSIHWVKTTEVQNCEITTTEETITQLAIEQTNCKVYPPNTILIAMYGQGKTRGQIAKLKISAATNQACAAIVFYSNLCSLNYLYELLLLKYEDIRAMARGGNQANLNMKLVASIPIPLPPLPLQQQFAEKIEAIEHQKKLIMQSIKEVETLFNSRMDYYFDG